jgi:hypothetical protein
VFGIVLWFGALFALRLMAGDPKMRHVYLRHRRYKAYYPRAARPSAKIRQAKGSNTDDCGNQPIIAVSACPRARPVWPHRALDAENGSRRIGEGCRSADLLSYAAVVMTA